jgi:hypothetical protein
LFSEITNKPFLPLYIAATITMPIRDIGLEILEGIREIKAYKAGKSKLMPVIRIVGPYQFRFYSRGEANEPPHIHVRRERLEAKFWLVPVVRLAHPGRFRSHELSQIAELVETHQQEFLEAWHEYFN